MNNKIVYKVLHIIKQSHYSVTVSNKTREQYIALIKKTIIDK